MSHSVIAASTQLTITLLLAITMCGFSVEGGKMKETKMVMYLQGLGKGPNATEISVAGINGTKSFEQSFGTITVIDNALTTDLDIKSREVGRARGMYVGAAREGNSLRMVFSIVMTAGQYNGSTLEIQGNDLIVLKQKELSVVSGTGAFRYARGYVLLEVAFVDPINLYAALKLHVTVRHPVSS